jgi:hypothetical protein
LRQLRKSTQFQFTKDSALVCSSRWEGFFLFFVKGTILSLLNYRAFAVGQVWLQAAGVYNKGLLLHALEGLLSLQWCQSVGSSSNNRF